MVDDKREELARYLEELDTVVGSPVKEQVEAALPQGFACEDGRFTLDPNFGADDRGVPLGGAAVVRLGSLGGRDAER